MGDGVSSAKPKAEVVLVALKPSTRGREAAEWSLPGNIQVIAILVETSKKAGASQFGLAWSFGSSLRPSRLQISASVGFG